MQHGLTDGRTERRCHAGRRTGAHEITFLTIVAEIFKYLCSVRICMRVTPTCKSIGNADARPCEMPAATTAPEWIMGPSYDWSTAMLFITDLADTESARHTARHTTGFGDERFEVRHTRYHDAVEKTFDLWNATAGRHWLYTGKCTRCAGYSQTPAKNTTSEQAIVTNTQFNPIHASNVAYRQPLGPQVLNTVRCECTLHARTHTCQQSVRI